eukprot:COSAG02_NODE_6166_length_3754_cov_34.198906_7_plen_99_part_00
MLEPYRSGGTLDLVVSELSGAGAERTVPECVFVGTDTLVSGLRSIILAPQVVPQRRDAPAACVTRERDVALVAELDGLGSAAQPRVPVATARAEQRVQ